MSTGIKKLNHSNIDNVIIFANYEKFSIVLLPRVYFAANLLPIRSTPRLRDLITSLFAGFCFEEDNEEEVKPDELKKRVEASSNL